MINSCFVRPNKPLICKRPNFNIKIPVVSINAPKMITVDSSTECHTTPDQVAARMVEYLDYQPATLEKAANSILEPHGGTGQLVDALLNSGIFGGHIMTIERHYNLVDFMSDRFKNTFVKINQGNFLEFSGDYDRIICNPPFSNINKHIDHVFSCLKVGGVAVCLVPVAYQKIDHEVLETLSDDTFLNCKINTKIIKIER